MTQFHSPVLKAILAPTNTGKTHYAIDRMLARESGVIGLPLRLLAREVYDKICDIKGSKFCALITGEEKIVPQHARYFVCTVEAMPEKRPQGQSFAFVAIDEVQLMTHPERGHIFTDKILHLRGTEETLLLGAETARELLNDLLPDIHFETRERFSSLSYIGPKKITRLPKRSVIVAFSTPEVYALAELMRRFRGGAAIVMGALSPRTRNAQAALYQSGEVDFLVATDAIGMGLNLDADHVAFASLRKFDGKRRRALTPMEVGQIAGRAGRFRNDGTFGPTGDCQPFEDELVARIENHAYMPLKTAEWRNSNLNRATLTSLLDTLATPAQHKRLRRIAEAVDETALNRFAAMPDIKLKADSADHTALLWEICQIPDFRNMTIDAHVRLLREIYDELTEQRLNLTEDFLNKHTSRLDHCEGGVDILATRLAHIRTWTFCAQKSKWLKDANHWVSKTREIEDRLSDALHEKLTAKFIDRRTRALLKRSGTIMEAVIKNDGEVWVEEHKIGRLTGLQFEIDESQSESEAKALREAAEKAVAPEVNRRLTSIVGGTHAIFTLSGKGEVMWGEAAIGRLSKGGSIFNPDVTIVGAEYGQNNLKELAEERMRDFLRLEVNEKLATLKSLKDLHQNAEASPEVKGFAYTLYENFGHLDRNKHRSAVNDLDQKARKPFREIGVTFGQYDVYMRDMIKPKPASLMSSLVAFGAGGDGKPFIPFAGVTSIANEGELSSENFGPQSMALAGYKACGPRTIRFDILNRLAGTIRQAQRESGTRRFQIMQEMLALLGCTYEEMRGVLTALGYQSQTIESEDANGLRPELSATVPGRFVENETSEKAKTEATNTEAANLESSKSTETTNDGSSDAAEPASPPATTDAQAQAAEKDNEKTAKPAEKTLSVYHFRTTLEDGTVEEKPNVEYWFLPFRGKKQGGSKFQGGNQNKNFRKDKRPHKKFGKSSPKFKNSEPRRAEDSPFAALAALKKDMGQKDKE